MMLPMFAREPSVPTMGIPQTGFTPTGAVAGLADTPTRTVELLCCSLRRRGKEIR